MKKLIHKEPCLDALDNINSDNLWLMFTIYLSVEHKIIIVLQNNENVNNLDVINIMLNLTESCSGKRGKKVEC